MPTDAAAILSAMPREMNAQITLRVPKKLIERADTIAAKLGHGGITPSTTAVMREALARGIESLERELKIRAGK